MPRRKQQPLKPTRPRGCEHCQFTGKVHSELLKRDIRCTKCARRPRNDKDALRELTAAEKRRTDSFLQRIVASKAIQETSSPIATNLPQHLLTTDRVMERWAVNTGSGLPHTDEDMNKLVERAIEHDDTFAAEPARPPQLDEETQVVVDRIYMGLNEDSRDFLRDWYRYELGPYVMAKRQGRLEWQVMADWHSMLHRLKDRFLSSGHDPLTAIVRLLP